MCVSFRSGSVLSLLAASALAATTLISASPVHAQTTFSNATAITIPGTGTGSSAGSPANTYPSNIIVAALTGTVTKVTVTLNGFGHTFPSDVDVLLVGPTGASTALMFAAGADVSVTNLTLTFDDAAATAIPNATGLTSGTFRPANYFPADVLPPPAPAGPYGTALSAFNGTNPNGTWSLFVADFVSGDSGTIARGWSLTITTAGGTVATPEPTALALLFPVAFAAALRLRRRR